MESNDDSKKIKFVLDTNAEITPLAERIAELYGRELIETFQNQVDSYLLPLRQVEEALKRQQDDILRALEPMREMVDRVGKNLREALKETSLFTPDLGAFQELLRKHFSPEKARSLEQRLLFFCREGWFVGFEIDGLSHLSESEERLASDKSGDMNAIVMEYVKSELERIENEVYEYSPLRKHIFAPAFAAHRRGEYFLSVPVFLAQADGLCWDAIRKSPFRKTGKPRLPETAEYIRELDGNPFWLALHSPLSTVLPINQSKEERPSDFSGLNRHQVLHGESLDYGTEMNSLKAISFLSYLVMILPDVSRAVEEAESTESE